MADRYELSNSVLLFMSDYEVFDLDRALLLLDPEESLPQGGEESNSRVSNLPEVISADVDADDVCSVCIDSFVAGGDAEPCLKQAPCGHIFHADCIATWLARRGTCPLCRLRILA